MRILVFLVAGLLLGGWGPADDLDSTSVYVYLTAALLAVGLYASTFGIALTEARHHWRLILLAVTVGVLVKATLIGSVLAWAFDDPRFWIFGIAVAQIDPLSVAALMRDTRVSSRAKTILGAWSSFDDPMTVLLAIYLPALVVTPQTGLIGGGVGDYLTGFAVNIALAAVVSGLWWLACRHHGKRTLIVGYVLLTAAFVAATAWLLMIALALIGLVLRPRGLAAVLDRTVQGCLLTAAVLVGIQMAGGVDIVAGIALGCAAYGAQIVVGAVLTARLPRADRLFIALAQQNGITAIIVSLLLESAYPGTVAVVMPAVVTANFLHALGRFGAPRVFRTAV